MDRRDDERIKDALRNAQWRRARVKGRKRRTSGLAIQSGHHAAEQDTQRVGNEAARPEGVRPRRLPLHQGHEQTASRACIACRSADVTHSPYSS